MAKSDLRIDVLGTSFTISAEEEPEYLSRLLEKYRKTVENVERISGLKDPLKTAILTGFLLCDDLEKTGIAEEGETNRYEAERLTLGMISRLDNLVSSYIPTDTKAGVYKLRNTVKNYDWGSPEWIPALTGQKNPDNLPWAELWMGVHPMGPSRIFLPGNPDENEGLLLSSLIAGDPEYFLGSETAHAYGTLPFLFKVLAAAKPLSIQAHPNLEQAREGFERENRGGIPLDAPHRNYKDPNHKPEIICALSPFASLCGFRGADETAELFEKLYLGISRTYTPFNVPVISQDGLEALMTGLERAVAALRREGENPLRAFLWEVFSFENQAVEILGTVVKAIYPALEKDFNENSDEWQLCSYLARLFPGDAGILAPLYLNIIELAPGEAMYIPAGVFHAYIHGLGIEIMADSDTVLRGGLTSKNIDINELFKILDFSEFKPRVMRGSHNENEHDIPGAEMWFSYPASVGEFSLSVIQNREGSVNFPDMGPCIVLITEGSAEISISAPEGSAQDGKEAVTGGTGMVLSKGESVFIPGSDRKGKVIFTGTFCAYVASPGGDRGKPSMESYREQNPPGPFSGGTVSNETVSG